LELTFRFKNQRKKFVFGFFTNLPSLDGNNSAKNPTAPKKLKILQETTATTTKQKMFLEFISKAKTFS
jgi:hypothetical protein